MVAAIHAVPYPDPSAPLAPHCFYCWYDMPEWYARDPPLLSCWEYLDAREPPPGVGGEVVFTHGDLHLKNLLVSLEDGSLVPVDFELSGRGHRLCGNRPLVWVVLTKRENSLARSIRSRFG